MSRLTEALENIIERHREDICAQELLEKASSMKIPGFNAAVQQLLDATGSSEPTTEFPAQNRAYKALVGIVKKWRKQDVHIHLSNCLRAKFISDQFSKKSADQREGVRQRALEALQIARNRTGARTKVQIQHLIKKWKDHEEFEKDWRDSGRLEKYLRNSPRQRFTFRGELRDVWIQSVDDLRHAVSHVAKNCLDDNVVDFDIRFNPYKPALLPNGTGLTTIVGNMVVAAHRGLLDAETQRNAPVGKRGMIFSFNRAKPVFRQDKCLLPTIIKGLSKLSRSDKALGKRMSGIDLSGPGEELSKCYKRALRSAGALGLSRTVHFDALRLHMRDDPKKVTESLKNMLSVVKLIDRIGHGLPLGIFRPAVLCAHDRAGNRRTIRKTLEGLWKTTEDMQLLIECCPSTNLKSARISDYRQHPFHDWVAEGRRVAIGIDGTDHWWPSHTRRPQTGSRAARKRLPWHATLSEEIVRLFLASPYGICLMKLHTIAAAR